jgi:hypothetical protein
MLMSAVNVPSGIAFGVTLMPANPVSPFRDVKEERYIPGGGSNLVGDMVEDVVEHAPRNSVQMMRRAVRRTRLFVIGNSLLSIEAERPARNCQRRGKRPKMWHS